MSAHDRTWISISLHQIRVALEQRQQECQSHSSTIAQQQEELCTALHLTPQTSLPHTLSYLKALTKHCNVRSDRLESYGWHGHEVELASLIVANATAICGVETAAWYAQRTLAKTARALWTCEETVTAEEKSFSESIDKLIVIQAEVLAQETSEHLTLRSTHVGQVEELLALAASREFNADFLERVQSLNDLSIESRVYVGNHERTVGEFMLLISELGVTVSRQSLITEYFEEE